MQKKISARALPESEALYLSLFTLAPLAICIARNNIFVDCNPKMLEMHRCERDDIIGKSASDLAAPVQPDGLDSAVKAQQLIKDLNSNKSASKYFEWLCKRPDGSEFLAEISINNIQTEGDDSLKMIIARDITQRKKNESELQRYRDQLNELVQERTREIQRQANIIEKLYDSVVSIDMENIVTSFSKGAERLHGYTSDEVIGKNFEILFPPDYRDNIEKMAVPLYENGIAEVESFALTKSGKIIPVHILASLIEGVDGQPQGRIGYAQDITARKEIELALVAAKEKAEQSERVKSVFLANMSHELRTPLNGILGILELLKFTSLDREQTEMLTTAVSAANSLLAIINNILDFSHIESGDLRIENKPFDLPGLVHDLTSTLARQAIDKNVEVNCSVPTDLPAISGEPERLCQILSILMNNALKFTQAGEVSVFVSLEKDTGAQLWLRFEVKDTGIGIPADKLGNLFEPFTQVDTSTMRKFYGIGLGLSMAKRLTALMDGEIGVSSAEGKGSTFWFTAKFDKT